MSRRLTTNPGVSLASMASLPSFLLTSLAVFSVSSEVRIVLTISTGLITGTGLKKCMPNTLSGRFVLMAISVTERQEVLLARMACAGQTLSSVENILFFSSMFSMTASITRSRSVKDSNPTTPLILLKAASLSWALIFPFSAALVREEVMAARPLSRNFWLTSDTTTLNPDRAHTSAMPDPISPQPTTPTFCIAIRLLSDAKPDAGLLLAGKAGFPFSDEGRRAFLKIPGGEQIVRQLNLQFQRIIQALVPRSQHYPLGRSDGKRSVLANSRRVRPGGVHQFGLGH